MNSCYTPRSVALLVTALISAPALAADESWKRPVIATATITSCDGTDISGQAYLVERPSEEGVKPVYVALYAKGLPAGKHAVHIHETANCAPCSAAGGHFDPGPASLTSPDGNHPYHSGDLVNLDVGEEGFGIMRTVTNRITLSPGPLSINDADGSAFIIHVDPDSYCPDGEIAGCAGGARAACGVITLK